MLKRLIITTAAAAMLVGSAAAQQTPPANQAPQKQESIQGARQFITQQTADQWLASKFNGTDVIGANNEQIGDVRDLLVDRNGRVVAYVIGVGGFLGIGERDVALSPTSFQIQPATDREAMKLRLAMTRDELKNAPEFKAATRPAPTTGQAPPRDRAPATPPVQSPVQR